MGALLYFVVIGVPALVFVSTLAVRDRGLVSVAASAASGLFVLAFVALVVRADLTPAALRWAPLAVFAVLVTVIVVRRRRALAHDWRRSGPTTRALVVLPLVAAALAPPLMVETPGLPDTPPVELAWPLREGRFVVVQGGNSLLLNHHFEVPAQRYALDVTRVEAGSRARGLSPAPLTDYRIYGTPVYAPCGGEVVLASRDARDQAIGSTDTRRPAGNFVALRCARAVVTLAHLRGPVLVKQGDVVRVGQALGAVGNSGNTTEPHLHIHAVDPAERTLEQILFRGRGVPMTFDGRFYQRNDVIDADGAGQNG